MFICASNIFISCVLDIREMEDFIIKSIYLQSVAVFASAGSVKPRCAALYSLFSCACCAALVILLDPPELYVRLSFTIDNIYN